jgi:hypothetical protein
MLRQAPTSHRQAEWTLQVVVRADGGDGPVLARETVGEGDLADVKSELWMNALLRRGRPDVPLAAMSCHVAPRFSQAGGNVIGGYRLETAAAGRRAALAFTPSSLEPVALRAINRLLDAKKIAPLSRVCWEVTASCRDVADAAPAPEAAAGDVIVREIPRPLDYLRIAIEPWRAAARPSGAVRPRDYPVFYTADALVGAARHARRGAAAVPPVESGAALLGPLCSCPRTGEFFAVVCAAEPIEDAAEERFSLTLSAQSWDRIERRLDAMRRTYGSDAFRLLGTAHGHPFKPVDDTEAADASACPYHHTACVSRADIAFARAVFAREAYQLTHVFGKDGAGRDVHALFGLRNGTLAWRGFSVVREFYPRQES